MSIPGYDAWRLSGPDEPPEIGTEDGQPCGRTHEADEDAPRDYRARPCEGEMVEEYGILFCDRCGESA